MIQTIPVEITGSIGLTSQSYEFGEGRVWAEAKFLVNGKKVFKIEIDRVNKKACAETIVKLALKNNIVIDVPAGRDITYFLGERDIKGSGHIQPKAR